MNKTLLSMADKDVTQMLSDCESLKPKDLILDPLKWKYLVRSVLRGKNILFVGPSREGKTKAARSVAEVFSEVKTEILDENQLNTLKSDRNIRIEKVEEM
jgi:MoxR-like ATPase